MALKEAHRGWPGYVLRSTVPVRKESRQRRSRPCMPNVLGQAPYACKSSPSRKNDKRKGRVGPGRRIKVLDQVRLPIIDDIAGLLQNVCEKGQRALRLVVGNLAKP